MKITNQDKEDLLNMLLLSGLLLSVVSLLCFGVSTALDISFHHSCQLVAAIITVIGILYIVREVFFSYWRIFVTFSSVILLAGFYGASTELYIKHFTFLGIGDLPALFLPVYLLIVSGIIGAMVLFIKKDFFHVDGIAFNGV